MKKLTNGSDIIDGTPLRLICFCEKSAALYEENL